MTDPKTFIFFPGDYVKISGKWDQVWNTLYVDGVDKIALRNGSEFFCSSVEEVLSNDEFFEQKSFGIVS